LTQKFVPMFAASRHNVFHALLTVRVVRNFLSHLQCQGPFAGVFRLPVRLTSEALSVLANVLGGHHPARLTERRAALLGSLGKPALPAGSAGSQSGSRACGGGDTGRFLPADDSLSQKMRCTYRPSVIYLIVNKLLSLFLSLSLRVLFRPHGVQRGERRHQVLGCGAGARFFREMQVPGGVESGRVDGVSLVNLCQRAGRRVPLHARRPWLQQAHVEEAARRKWRSSSPRRQCMPTRTSYPYIWTLTARPRVSTRRIHLGSRVLTGSLLAVYYVGLI